jgi:hypothetical protein
LTPQVLSGAIFVAIGLLGLVLSRNYELGTATHMGPGYFPFVLSVLMVLLGIGGIVQSLLRRERGGMPRWEFLDLVFLLLGVVLFGLLIDRGGLLAAVTGLLVPSCYWRLRRRPLEVALLCVVMTAFSGAIFIETFGLPFEWLH